MVGVIFPDRPPLREQTELVRYPERRGIRMGMRLRDPAGTGRFNPFGGFHPGNQPRPASDRAAPQLNLDGPLDSVDLGDAPRDVRCKIHDGEGRLLGPL